MPKCQPTLFKSIAARWFRFGGRQCRWKQISLMKGWRTGGPDAEHCGRRARSGAIKGRPSGQQSGNESWGVSFGAGGMQFRLWALSRGTAGTFGALSRLVDIRSLNCLKARISPGFLLSPARGHRSRLCVPSLRPMVPVSSPAELCPSSVVVAADRMGNLSARNRVDTLSRFLRIICGQGRPKWQI